MINRLKSFFVSSYIGDPAIEQEVRKTNLTRSLIITCSGILFSAAIISAFSQTSSHHTALELQWRSGIVQLNLITITVNTLITCVGLYLLRYKNTNHVLYVYLPHVLMVLLGAWGVAGTVLYQLISWNIIPFILLSFVLIMLLIRPVVLFYYFILLYAVFYFLIPIHQPNPKYVLLNKILGFVVLVISYCFSSLNWNSTLLRFRQSRLIEVQSEKLKESNASKDKFFSILSHDLKGPIATSLVLTDMLQEENISEQERKEIQALFRSSLENVSRLLNNVLLWANNQSGKINFNPATLNLKELVEEDIQLLHAMAVHKNISLINEIPADLTIHADQHMMHTVVRNLLTNAIKFTYPKGTVSVFAERLAANKVTPVDHVKISIVDNGIGISPALLGDLFKLDKKVMTPGTNNEMGTGLGLILCKDFVEKHKGHFFVESDEATGSRFMFTIPV